LVHQKNIIKRPKRLVWFLIYVLYASFILISATAYFAEEQVDKYAANSKSYVITFNDDGSVEHYSVKLEESSEPGKIWVTYNSDEHHLDVKTLNIEELEIDCKSIAEEKTMEILNLDIAGNEEEYKQYFIEKNKFTIKVDNDQKMMLTVKQVPYPSRVILNSQPLKLDQDYQISDGEISTTIPKDGGYVSIYFSDTASDLRAEFKTENNKLFHLPNHEINFDASYSIGSIDEYIWDFCDGTIGDGVLATHQYSSPGYYDVTLVVRDRFSLINRITKVLSVFDANNNGLPDDWEKLYEVDDPNTDEDSDGLTNIEEFVVNSNPIKEDSDGDGFTDGQEISAGTDPLLSESAPEVIEKRSDENIFSHWMFYIIILIIIIVILILFIFVKNKTKKEEKLNISKKTNLPIRRPLKTKIIKKPFVHSALPPEVYNSDLLQLNQPTAQKQEFYGQKSPEVAVNLQIQNDSPQSLDQPQHPQQPQPAPLRPVFPKPMGQQEYELDNKMIDKDFKLPNQDDSVYECPTCNSSVGDECFRCPECGEEFEE